MTSPGSLGVGCAGEPRSGALESGFRTHASLALCHGLSGRLWASSAPEARILHVTCSRFAKTGTQLEKAQPLELDGVLQRDEDEEGERETYRIRE